MKKIDSPQKFVDKLINCGWKKKDFQDRDGLRDEVDIQTGSELSCNKLDKLVDDIQAAYQGERHLRELSAFCGI